MVLQVILIICGSQIEPGETRASLKYALQDVPPHVSQLLLAIFVGLTSALAFPGSWFLEAGDRFQSFCTKIITSGYNFDQDAYAVE